MEVDEVGRLIEVIYSGKRRATLANGRLSFPPLGCFLLRLLRNWQFLLEIFCAGYNDV